MSLGRAVPCALCFLSSRQYSHEHLYLLCHPWGQEVLLVLRNLCHPGADKISTPNHPFFSPLQLRTTRPGARMSPTVQLIAQLCTPPPQHMAMPGGWRAQLGWGYLLSSSTGHAGSLGGKQRTPCWALPMAACPGAGAGRGGPAGQHHLLACRVVLDRPAERQVSLPVSSPTDPCQPTGTPLCPHLLSPKASRSWSSLWQD